MPIRLRSVALATTALCALAAPLAAQSVPVPPTRELIDGNGVDLFRGTFTVDQTIASIGGSQGLTYRRINRGTSYWTDNIEAFIQSGANIFTVTVAGRTDRFLKSGSTYIPTEANGSTLSFSNPIYTYTARDGTVATFDKSMIESYNQFGNEGLATSIVEPNGNRVDLTYKRQRYCEYYEGDFCSGGYSYAKRLNTATSAYGYAVSYSYALDFLQDGSQMFEWTTVTDRRLINRAIDFCANNQCVMTQNWPGDTNPNHLVNTYVTTGSQITGVSRPGSTSNDVTITYASGKVASVADHAGSTSYAYADVAGSRNVTVTNALGEASLYTFLITSERLTKYKDPLNNETNYTYDASGRLTRITKPEGNYTNYTYDARGNVTETRAVAKSGSGAADIFATATFPATCTNIKICNSPTATTDPRGNVTDYSWDATHGGVLTVTSPAPTIGATRPKQTFTYVSQQAQVKSSTGTIIGSGTNITLPATVSQCATLASCTGGADEIKSAVTYGANGVANNLQPTQVASGNGSGTLTATTGLAYDMIGNLVTVDGPLVGTDDTTTAIYDGLRRPYGTISPDPDGAGGRPRLAQRSTFATNGDVTKVEIGTETGTTAADLAAMTVAQGTDMVYDADGRKLRDTLTGGGTSHAVTQYSYDAEGRLSCAAQRMNPATWASLPASACTLGTTGSFGPDRITKSLRDLNGRVTQVQAAFGTADVANERTLAYSNNGALAHLIDANNNRTTYEVDGHDRLTKTRFPLPAIGANSSSTTDYEQLTLDPASNVTSRRLRDGQVIGYTYDALNRLTEKDRPGTELTATFGYDLAGRMTATSHPGYATSMGRDALGRMTHEQQGFGRIDWQYDLAGRRTRTSWWDGFYVDYQRDLLGNLTFVRENGAATGVGVLATYQYDSLSRRASQTFGNGVVTNYAFDPVTRLASQTTDLASTANDLTQTFSYNPASQISSVTRSNDLYAWTGHTNENLSSTANGLNQIANVGAKATTHDARGNITAVGTQTYAYTSENLLSAASGGTTLYYDPLLRLVEYDTNISTRFVYEGAGIAAEVDNPAGAIQRRYVRGDGMDELLVEYVGSGTTGRRFLTADERGSIIAVTDSAGAVVAINKYDEYGVPQSTNIGRFGYTGQAWFGEVGLWYYKARMYGPKEGRFYQTDPIGYKASPNLYAYVGNDPINLNDQNGLWPVHGTQLNFVRGFISAPRDIWWGANFSYRLSRGDSSAQATLNAYHAGVAMLSNDIAEASQIFLQIAGNNKAFLTGRMLGNLATTVALTRIGGTIGFRIGVGGNIFSVGSGSLRAVDRALTQIRNGGFSTSGLSDRSLARLIIAGAAGMNVRFDESSGTIFASERDPTGRIPGPEVEVCKFDDNGVCQPPTKKGN